MNTHQLHELAAQIARQERITHREACARLGRRGRGKSKQGNYGRTTVGPSDRTAFSTIEKPAAVYWWQD
jgi:hypothetical protein